MYRSNYLLYWLSLALFACSVASAKKCGYRVQRLPSPRNTVGEVPHWDAKTRSLYYVDIAGYNSSLLRYDYDENRVYQARIDNAATVLFILPIKCKKDYYLVGIDLKAVIVYWNGRSPKATVISTLFEFDETPTNVINDIKTDKFGRFYGGTKSVESCDTGAPATGAFYTYNKRKGVKKFFGDVYISNGLTWLYKKNKFYYADSCAYDIKEFDYDPKSGNLANGRQIFSLIRNGVKPEFVLDGMTNDRHGNLYVATFGGSKIIKFNPRSRKVVMEIELPATQITSLAFGGPKLNILYVTTANKDGKQPEGSGYLYKITGLCAKGYRGVRLNLC